MLPQTNFGGLCRESYIAIDHLRPKPDPVDHASGWKFRRQRMSLSAASRHSMQLTQFSTSVPCSAICRSRM
jgi:hypothetical protein